MANTYRTTINQMWTVDTPEQGFVVNVQFTVSGTDGTNTATVDGNISFQPETQENFVPYTQLTDAIVLGWINEATDNQANYYANIDGQIDSMVNPPTSPQNTPLPWATA